MGRASSSSRGRKAPRPENHPFTTFVTNVITRAELTTPVILASLVYIDRAKPHLHIALEEWALERVFLGAVIIASKVCYFTAFFDMPQSLTGIPVLERFYSQERPLGVMYGRIRETRRRSHRTRVLGRARLPTQRVRGRHSLPPP
jgi:hypothetical protein